MGDISVKKTKIDGFRKHRSHATAQSCEGMTCFLKPALTLINASLPCHSYKGMCVGLESMGGGSRVTFRAKHSQFSQ